MNVLILAKDCHIGGLVTSTETLARGLQKYKGVKAVVALPQGNGIGFRMDGLDVEIIDFGTKSPLKMIQNYNKLKTIINKNNIDVIHAQNRIPAIYAAAYCFYNKKVKYLWANHQVPIASGLLHRLTTLYGSFAVTDCIAGKDLLVNDLKINESKVRVINLGMDLSLYHRTTIESQNALKDNLNLLPEEKVIFLYGRLSKSKGHLLLLEALSKISNRNFKLIFPGEADDFKNEVSEKAKELGLLEKLIFPGFVQGNDYLSISDLMVLPSYSESFSYSCTEAYSVGVPVIRSKSGGYEDTKDLCWGFEIGNAEELAQLLSNFFENQQPFLEKAEYGKEKVNRLSLKYMIDSYYHLYNQMLTE